MQYKTLFSFSLLFFFSQLIVAQNNNEKDSTNLPTIEYSTTSLKYEIAEIKVTGASNYEDFVLIGFSGLAVGDIVSIPGDAITKSVKRFWKQGLFSDVKILATKLQDGKVWLTIALKERPRISEINYVGLKKSEIDDISLKVGLTKENQITPNISDRAKKIIEKHMEEKGFLNVEVSVLQKNDPAKPGHVIVDVIVDKKLKTKIHQLFFSMNQPPVSMRLNKGER